MIQPGRTILLTAGDQGTATNVAINAPQAGTVTFTRETAAVLTAFTSWDDEAVV